MTHKRNTPLPHWRTAHTQTLHVPRQNGLRTAQVSGRFPPFSKVTNAEGVVIAVRYPDDELNRSRAYVEYDVRDLATGQVYRACRRMHAAAGIEGDEYVLRAASQIVSGEPAMPGVFNPNTARLSDSDGDRVVVQFINGAHHSAVIAGVLSTRRTPYGARRADGRRRITVHAGTTLEFRPDGTWKVWRADPPVSITIDPEGVLTLDAPTIKHGEEAIERAVLGDTTATIFDALSANVLTASAALAALPQPVTPAAIVAVLVPLFTSLHDDFAAFRRAALSEKVKIE